MVNEIGYFKWKFYCEVQLLGIIKLQNFLYISLRLMMKTKIQCDFLFNFYVFLWASSQAKIFVISPHSLTSILFKHSFQDSILSLSMSAVTSGSLMASSITTFPSDMKPFFSEVHFIKQSNCWGVSSSFLPSFSTSFFETLAFAHSNTIAVSLSS